MHAQPSWLFFRGKDSLWPQHFRAKLWLFYRGTDKITDTVMLLDEQMHQSLGIKNQLTITVILSGNQQCSTGSATCYPQCFDLGNRLIDGSETRLHYAQESTGITAHTPHERQLLVSGRRLRVQKWSTHNNEVSSFLIQDGTGMFLH